jgi:hypothetical protein
VPNIFDDGAPVLRLTLAEFACIRVGRPVALEDSLKGFRWVEIGVGGIRIREFRGIGPDGWIIDSFRPVIRVQAISRLVPRPKAMTA